MDKSELIDLTNEKFGTLFNFLEQHDDNKWDKGPEGKWTTGQHIIHLIQSAKPLNQAMGLPMFVLWYKFGKANRGPRTYDQVAEKYHSKLKAAGNVVSPFSANMPDTPIAGKQDIINQLAKQKDIHIKRIKRISEKNLDKYLIPHPLLGRMLIREIIMWHSCHAIHHLNTLKEKY